MGGHPQEGAATAHDCLQIISKLLHVLDFRFWHTFSRIHCPKVFLDLALTIAKKKKISQTFVSNN
jgi:hypothetical protein